MTDITPLRDFLPCSTPDAWIGWALAHPDILLIDHAHCEKKAASTAINLMFRYVDRPELLDTLSRLAREELLHFEQVLAMMRERGVVYDHLSPARYAQGLRLHVRTSEPGRLVDILIVGALIEARSCERFAALAPHVDAELGRYYRYLLKSESRHFQDYLDLAERYANGPIAERVAFFKEKERALIEEPDREFRFHSGVPKIS
ncbi:tRNA-(ms[2]io[6]A)-hydroxylase [Alloalcanivorax mobilis]|uniref:tRNA-(ms[2]io[6]A)-hydroxylase n=1 Tax=Alloalcanivorax mobilis TaxID=2019569 RepID=UPI000B5B35F1|nr:tRNA-(ms[2]io[6]A)-hydroxylase [Alloalcanivorax mobilis]ASK33963.1 tRNA-(ms[2]io[6]A)-hydroxylase [Alcanivorax sp. N3-2A]|tara:strand:+ start:4106 stop:4714 length:609 start_codon:yes stop_codon:yes gene_type:complete